MLSRIIIHSAIMLALMSSAVFILLLYHFVMSLLIASLPVSEAVKVKRIWERDIVK